MIDEIVLRRYNEELHRFLDGGLDPDRFAAIRLQQGIYAQLQEGYYMVRTKFPGGRLQSRQLIGMAEIVEAYCQGGHKAVHLTTRQDVQFHFLRIEDTPRILRHLADCGITTREASGNTVRNVTACPLAGVCPGEHVDVHLYADAIARHFIGNPLTRQLPRKFKIGLSGCAADCARGLINDVGLIARERNGENGFRLFAFGGLGANPMAAVEIDPFVPEQDLLAAVEAVLILHHRHSDRDNRNRARSKFLRERFGIDRLIEMYQAELQRCRASGRSYLRGLWRRPEGTPPCNRGDLRTPVPQRIDGLYALPIRVRLGQLCNRQLRGMAALMEEFGLQQLRATIDQNLLLVDVPEASLDAVRDRLAHLGLAVPSAGDNVVSCPGALLCPQAITTAQPLAVRLDGGAADLQIRVNGCQNGCAHSDVSDIGLYGQGRRHFGTLVPSYALQLGGDGRIGGGLAVAGPAIPARRTPDAVRRIHEAYANESREGESFRDWVLRMGGDYFETLLADLSAVADAEVAALARDLGTSAAFSVAKRGIAECAGGREDPLVMLEAELLYQRNNRNAFLRNGNLAEARACIESAVNATVGAVDRIHGGTGQETGRAATRMRHWFPRHPELVAGFEEIAAALPAADADVAALATRAEQWIAQVTDACRTLRQPARSG